MILYRGHHCPNASLHQKATLSLEHVPFFLLYAYALYQCYETFGVPYEVYTDNANQLRSRCVSRKEILIFPSCSSTQQALEKAQDMNSDVRMSCVFVTQVTTQSHTPSVTSLSINCHLSHTSASLDTISNDRK